MRQEVGLKHCVDDRLKKMNTNCLKHQYCMFSDVCLFLILFVTLIVCPDQFNQTSKQDQFSRKIELAKLSHQK